MWNGILQQGAQGLGYNALVAAQVEGLVLVNQHVFVPLLEKADIAVTRKIWGEEAALKSEQDWYYVKQKLLEPVFNFVSITNSTL